MIENKIGIEFEFFVETKNGELVFPGDHGFDTDEYIILGEARCTPGKSVVETLSNFYSSWFSLLEIAEKKNLKICINPYRQITKEFSADIARKMGTKTINNSRNIYNIDLLQSSDEIIEDNKIIGKYISIGMHIHFSSYEIKPYTLTYSPSNEFEYTKVKFPLMINDIRIDTEFYTREKNPLYNPNKKSEELVLKSSKITVPVIEWIVKKFDDEILPNYVPNVALKYRNPGFYETKFWGFEYRSLPMSPEVFNNLYNIVKYGFNLLDKMNEEI